MSRTYRRGQVYDWRGLRCHIRRVAVDQSWADIAVMGSGGHVWTKRVRLPLDDKWRHLGDEGVSE